MAIKQFNGEWVPREDRVRFRFNTSEGEEYRFWLTRRIVQGLIIGTQHLAVKALEQTHRPQVAQAVQAFQQQTVTQQANFQENYQDAPQKPLGDEPLLVLEVVIQQRAEQIAVEFQLSTGQSVHIQMAQHAVHVLVTLLNKLQDTAQWGIGLPLAVNAPALPDISPVVH